MTLRVYSDPDVGSVTLRKNRGSRRITLRVSPRKGVIVTMPWIVPYKVGLEFFMSKKDWVLKAIERQKARLEAEPAHTPEEVEALRAKAKAELPKRLAELAEEYSFSYNTVRIKHNVSNWGSCSRKGNINLNLHLVRLPDDLRDYVMLHELCHLRHPDHGLAFHALLESLCPGHRAKEKALRAYRLW